MIVICAILYGSRGCLFINWFTGHIAPSFKKNHLSNSETFQKKSTIASSPHVIQVTTKLPNNFPEQPVVTKERDQRAHVSSPGERPTQRGEVIQAKPGRTPDLLPVPRPPPPIGRQPASISWRPRRTSPSLPTSPPRPAPPTLPPRAPRPAPPRPDWLRSGAQHRWGRPVPLLFSATCPPQQRTQAAPYPRPQKGGGTGPEKDRSTPPDT